MIQGRRFFLQPDGGSGLAVVEKLAKIVRSARIHRVRLHRRFEHFRFFEAKGEHVIRCHSRGQMIVVESRGGDSLTRREWSSCPSHCSRGGEGPVARRWRRHRPSLPASIVTQFVVKQRVHMIRIGTGFHEPFAHSFGIIRQPGLSEIRRQLQVGL